jgi:hypothetical protein
MTDSLAWRISIGLQSGEFCDRVMALGVSADALRGKDARDLRKPRAVGDIPSVYFDRPEWDKDFSAFATDIRPPIQKSETWDFVVRAGTGRPVSLSFSGLDAISSRFKAALVDVDHARVIDLHTVQKYDFTQSKPLSGFRVIVGTEEEVNRQLENLLPKDFALENNYPNPFNPSTTISISVPRTSEVTLKIYNILGEEVRTVFHGPLEAGRYYFVWEGKNENGAQVATGIYLSRLTTSTGASFVHKMMLIK